MRRTPRNRHDKFFRGLFSDPSIATPELQRLLPARIVRAIDWRTLKPVERSHIDASLREKESDVIFEARLRSGRAVVLYVLFEHQSGADRLLPYRLLVYMVRIWEAWRAANPKARYLPVILPLVLSNAGRPWRGPRSLGELYRWPKVLRESVSPHLPDFQLILDDLATATDADLMGRPAPEVTRLALLALKSGRQRRGWQARLQTWAPLLQAVVARPDGAKLFEQVLSYVMFAVDDMEHGELVEAAREAVGNDKPEVVKMGLTLGERLLRDGRREGRVEGRLAEARASVRRVLARRELAPTPEQERRIDECTDLGALGRWLDAAIVATSAAEVLDGA